MRSPSETTGEAATIPAPAASRLHVIDGERVGRDVGDALPAALVFGFNLVGADGLNLIQHILLAGHADGYHQNEGSRADHHAKRSQRETDLIAAESLVGKAEDLAVNHTRRTSFRRGRRGSRHAFSG